jgi:DNA repair protein RecO (recombination protein O)
VPLVASDATVLHAFAYMESSRILRLATRELGVVSVLAKGARKAQRRFGTALDLFAEGEAQFYTKPGRDLHTLGGFDVTRARLALGTDLDRFAAAAAIAELVLHLAHDEAQPTWYDALVTALDAVAAAPPGRARDAGLAGAWQLVGAFGVTPSLDACAHCHAPLAPDEPARFSHPAAARSARAADGSADAPSRRTRAPCLRAWIGGGEAPEALDDLTARAHQRLLREYLREHLTDGRALRAFETWETGRWTAAAPVEHGA